MFELGIIGLVSAYVLTLLLLLSINLYANIAWKIKALSIIVATLFYIITWQSIPPLLGWPTSAEPPQKFRLVAADVEQPDKQSGYKGVIYLWVKNVSDRRAPPRAYQLPYSDPLYESVIKAKSKMKNNMPQLGEFKKPEQANITIIENLDRAGQTAFIEFYDLPDPLIPEK